MTFARLGLLAVLIVCGAASTASAQIDSRFAGGVEFTVAATGRASSEDYAHSGVLIEPLWRFGTTEPGWGFHWGLNWYAVDVDRPIGGSVAELGEIHIRPIMAGYGYTWNVRRNAITAALLGGFSFNSMSLAQGAADAYRTRIGVQATDADASNTFVLRPEVAIWHDLNRSFGLNVNVGYMLARPDVTVMTNTGAETRTARADQFLIKVGLVYSIF